MSERRSQAFRPRARLMLLLGDQLIRDSGIALVELVKNAYDADASECSVELSGVESTDAGARVVIEDDGAGMDLETVLGVWLEPATEHRRRQRARGERTRRHGRTPLGEKGVGRFAVHKLGRRVRLVTRRSRSPEVVVDIDWEAFESDSYLDEVPITVEERPAERFRGRRSGTRIEISNLRTLPWRPTQIQTIHRAMTSVASPFEGPGGFLPKLSVTPEPPWLRTLLRPQQLLEEALFTFRGRIESDRLSYVYEFRPRGSLEGVEGRRVERRKIPVDMATWQPSKSSKPPRRVRLSDAAIGAIDVELRLFDRDPKVLRLTAADPVSVGRYLDRNGGVRVYRDGVRVYDYGEPGDDWLELGARRLPKGQRRVAKNQVLGAVHLEAASSADLVEKTNREGFVENEAFEGFRQAVLFTLVQAEAERSVDRSRIRVATAPRKKKPVVEELEGLRREIERLGLTEALGSRLERVREQYQESLDRLLAAAGAGLSLASSVHEVERGLEDLAASLEEGAPRERLAGDLRELNALVEGLTWMTRRSGRTLVKGADLLQRARFNAARRLESSGVEVSEDLSVGDDFRILCSRRLVTSALLNLIDNSLYWLENQAAPGARLHLATTREPNGAPGLMVADSGPGFIDPPDELVQAFFTRKPDGMGLGLHIVDRVMKAHGGRLCLMAGTETEAAGGLAGAVAILEFPAVERG